MPTSAATTFTNAKLEPIAPRLAQTLAVKLKASTTYPLGCLLGEVTASPGTFGPYASGNSDGTQNPKAILPYACVTDGSSNITLGTASGGGEFGQTYKAIDVYIKGEFNTADLPQSSTGAIDSTAVASGSQLILKQGSTSAGVVELL